MKIIGKLVPDGMFEHAFTVHIDNGGKPRHVQHRNSDVQAQAEDGAITLSPGAEPFYDKLPCNCGEKVQPIVSMA